MTTRIDLGNDQWAELRDIDEMRAGDKRAAKASVSVRIDPETGEQIVPGDYDERQRNALAARLVTNWSLSLPLPKNNVTVLDKLTFEQSKNLYKGLQPYVDLCNEAAEDPEKEGTDPTDD